MALLHLRPLEAKLILSMYKSQRIVQLSSAATSLNGKARILRTTTGTCRNSPDHLLDLTSDPLCPLHSATWIILVEPTKHNPVGL